MPQMPDSFKPIDMPDSFQPISVSIPSTQLSRQDDNGLIEPGNIDLMKQPKIPNPEVGGMSTVYSIGVNIDGKEYLLPRVTPDGRFLTTDQAVEEFKRTGKHLGAFKDVASSNAYAQKLHEDYESGKYEPKGLLERTWNAANTPLIDIRSGGLKTATDEFAAEHPYIGKPMNFATDVLSSLTSPLNVGLSAITGGATLAEKAGLIGLASALEVPGKVAATGMIGHGGYNLLRPSASPEERIGGALEAGLGGLGLRGKSPFERVEPTAIEPKPQLDLPLKLDVEVPKVNVDELSPVDRVLQRMHDEIPVDEKTGMKIYNPEGVHSLELPKPEPTAVQKLQTAIEDIKPLNKEQQKIYSLERSERLGKAKGVSTPGQAGYYEQLGQLKGPMEKVTFEPLKLEQPDVDELFNTISNHPASVGYNEIKAKTGLAKLLQGQVPQRSEIDLLNQVFGKEVISNIESHIPVIDKAGGLLSEAVNLPKSLMASFDLSAPFRQGLGLAHKAEFWTSFDDMVKSFGSEKAFQSIQDNIQTSPNFQLSQDVGLHLSNLTNMNNREEAFMSSWAERIPGVGRVVRASDRAYVGFLNKLRFDTFSRLMDDAESTSKSLLLTAKNDAELSAAKLANPKTNNVLATEFANFVNTATGRGNLGKLESSAVALNNMFFSPRLIASRVRMLNPQTYISASPAVRKEYLKSLLAIASVGGIVGSLGKAAGGEVSDQPYSSDLGKIKFGDTRLDPFGGFQQYVVAANRLISGQQTSSTSGNTYDLGSKYGLPTRLDVLKNFTANKLAPVPRFAYDLLNANKQQPFSFSDEAARLFVPMVIQDTIDLANSNPKLIPALTPLSGLGMGVQTYPQPGIIQQIKELVR